MNVKPTVDYDPYKDSEANFYMLQDVSVRFTVMDQDRHIGDREIGRALVSLKEAKQTIQVHFPHSHLVILGNLKLWLLF